MQQLHMVPGLSGKKIKKLNISRLVDYAINNNGVVKPIIIPADDLSFPALTNPSIAEKNGELYICLRNMSHTLFHAENDRFHHILGKNVLCNKEDENNDIKKIKMLCNFLLLYF